MENNENFINSFINNLKTKQVKANIYKNTCTNIEYNSKDVISNVCNQVKAIQNADKLLTPLRKRNEFNMYSRIGLLPVTKMSEDQQSNRKQAAEFETQCVSDTQLINIVEHAEALIEESKHIPIKTDTTVKKDIDVHRQHTNQCGDVEKYSENAVTNNNDITKCDHSVNETENGQQNDSSNRCIKNEESNAAEIVNMEVEFNNQLEESSKSPKSKAFSLILKTYTPPLVFNLESFENFESIAMPVVKENLDFEAAKEVINSQISKELFVQTHAEPVLYDRDKSLSPIFEVKVSNADLKENTITQMKNGMYIIEDDILLSNDEENDTKNNKELPLTCALETSFYDQDNLDKIMYVGFQTASNKSIHVPTESYSKAKTILDEKIDGLPLTKLVEIFDNSYNNSVKEQNTVSSKNIDIDNNYSLSVRNKTAYEKPLKITEKDLINSETLLSSHNKIKYEEKSPLKNNNERETEFVDCSKNISEQIDIDDHIIAEFENNFLVESEQNLKHDFTPNVEMPAKNNKKLDFTTDIDAKTRKLPNDSYNHIPIGGFKTARNKEIKITDTGLAKMKSIFDDIDLKDLTIVANDVSKESIQNFNFNGPSTSRQLMGFKTANNKIIKVSEKSLEKTKNIFDNIDTENVEKKCESISSSSNILKEKNNNVTVKNRKLCPKESKKPIQVLNIDIAKQKEYFENFSLNNENKTTFSGFKTASNKPVTISEDVLRKSKKIFQDIDKEIVENPEVFDDEVISHHKNISKYKFKGFSTANNKIIPISKNALLKSKKVFQDIDESDVNMLDQQEENVCTFKGFKTASNKHVKISAESLTKSKNIFKDINLNNDTELSGFKTANNKQVTISNRAMAKTKSIFNDIDDEDFEIPKDTLNKSQSQTSPTFDGFKTTSNNAVEITKDAFAKTKDKFRDPYVDMDINTNKNLCGFQTASNKKVQISEEALLHSKKIFNDIEQYQNEPTKNKEIETEIANANLFNIHEEALNNEKSKVNDVNNVDVDLLFNTEVAKDFEESFYIKEIPRSKRSGSPILSFPKAKRRKKFVIPQAVKTVSKVIDTETLKPCNIYKFDENYKKEKRYKLKDIKEIEKLNNCEAKIDPYVLNFKFDSLLDFEFGGKRNDIDNDRWTIDDIKKLFTDSVNKKIIPENWLDIQLKLIIWKLLSYEIVFPKTMNNSCTIKNVLHQLKYRYDRELYNVVRPPIRKILEKDEVPGKMMVLCVVGFYVDGVSVSSFTNSTQNIELLLTDGWYTIKACTDRMIDQLICDGKIVIGTKLLIHGAELLNCDQGISPWEDISSVRLKICGNSIKRAKWDTRLGFHGNGSMLSRLSTIKVNGGKVSRLRSFVTRVYPMMYVEKFDNGNTVTRSERLEHLYQMKFETERQIEMEKLYEEVEKYSEQEDDSEGYNSGTQICRLMKNCRAPSQFRACLTDTQVNLLQEHNNKKRERLIDNLQRKVEELIKIKGLNVTRNVVPLLKIRVVDVDKDNISKAMLTIWRPNESLLELIQEGTWIDIYNVVPTAVRYSELQISAGRQSIFKKSNYNTKIKQTFKRKPYAIKDINPITTDYNEVDTAGFIFLIEPSTKEYESSKQLFQNVYLSDENKNIIIIIFWGGIKKFGFDNILEVGQVVSCVNLEIRHGNTKNSIPQFRATEFTYFTKTCKMDELRQITELLRNKFVGIDKKKFIDDCVACKNSFSNFKYGRTDVTPFKMNNSDLNISKNKQFIDTPLVALRKKRVDDKISKLQMYGEPPPLQTINLINKSNVIYNSFRSPLPSDTSVRNLPQNSPVLNRTYVKNINPVKLNFAEEDPFAEDFDPSPPLSLE